MGESCSSERMCKVSAFQVILFCTTHTCELCVYVGRSKSCSFLTLELPGLNTYLLHLPRVSIWQHKRRLNNRITKAALAAVSQLSRINELFFHCCSKSLSLVHRETGKAPTLPLPFYAVGTPCRTQTQTDRCQLHVHQRVNNIYHTRYRSQFSLWWRSVTLPSPLKSWGKIHTWGGRNGNPLAHRECTVCFHKSQQKKLEKTRLGLVRQINRHDLLKFKPKIILWHSYFGKIPKWKALEKMLYTCNVFPITKMLFQNNQNFSVL